MAFGPSAALVLAVVVGVLLHAGSAAPSDGDPGGVYFPLRSVELKVYVDAKTGNLLPPPTGVILSPWLFSDAGVVEAAGVTYRLTDPASPAQSPNLPWLSVDAKTGLLKVKAQRVLTDNGARRRHVVWLDARTASRAPAHRAARPFMVPSERARLNITITFELLQEDRPCVNKLQGLAVAPEDPCHYCHDSCFLNNAELQIWENKPAVLVAPLGHVHADVQCGDRHQYTLKNGTEHFEILDSGLHTRGPLDRDALFNASAADSQRGPGPLVALAVECRTSWGTTEERVIPVHVLDEDDNAPVLEKDEKLEFNFTTEASLARGAHILVKDMDSRAANRFGELQVVDPSGVVAHKKLEFEGTHGGVQHTLVSIRLQVKDPMEAHYNVTLTLTDLTLKESDGASKDLRLSATLWGPPLTPPVAMSSSKTADSKPGPASRRRRASDQTHDHQDSVTAVPAADDYAVIPRSASVWTNAARYSRLLALGALNDSLKYQLGTGSPAWAGVTEGAGILYVSDPRALQATTEPHVVRVEALSDRGVPTVGYAVNVTVKTAKGRPCAVLANETCGQHISKKDCTNSCGSGSQGECTWREFQPSNVVTRNFSTCTPHADTCPDFVCDPLELLDPKICPQDCTGASF